MYGSGNILGYCPKCGGKVIMGRYGPFCTRKCGMRLGYAMGQKLTEKHLKRLLDGSSIYLTGLMRSNGQIYDAYVIPEGIEPFSYTTKAGEKRSGFQFKFRLQSPGMED